jgi:hypothetical protein
VAGAPAHIVLLVGGPTTEGGGAVVAKELVEPVRSHKDIAKDAAPLHKKALKYYDALASQLVAAQATPDLSPRHAPLLLGGTTAVGALPGIVGVAALRQQRLQRA